MNNSLIKTITKITVCALFTIANFALAASTTPQAKIQKQFQKYLGVEIDKQSITKMPFLDLYEVQIDDGIAYTDKEGQFLILGRVIDLVTHKDYTEQRLKSITSITFDTLPKEYAIKIIKGNGKGSMAIFSDPNCAHCKQLEYNLRNVSNVTIYLYPYNILSEKSKTISSKIWCSANPSQAWQNWMIHDKTPERTNTSCSFPNEQIMALGKKLKINGTPTIFFSDGSRVPGAIEAEDINRKLKSLN